MTRRKLAELIDCSEGYINLLEYGERTPTIPRLIKITKTLECSFNDLLQDYNSVVAEPIILNNITRRMQGLSEERRSELEAVISTMLSYMEKSQK